MNVDDEPSTLDPDLGPAPSLPETTTDVFAFRIAGRGYGLPAADVEQVASPQTPTPIPTVPAHVRGVVHLRGRILTVIDLAMVLQLDGAGEAERERHLVVVAGDPHPYAFLADSTLGILTVPLASIRPPGETPEDGALVRGRFDDASGVVSILDATVLLQRLLAAGTGAAA